MQDQDQSSTSIPSIPATGLVDKALAGLHSLIKPQAQRDAEIKLGKDYFKQIPDFLNESKAPPKPAAKPNIIDHGSYKSLADLQASGYGKDKKFAQYNAARELKDPFSAPTPQLQMISVGGKLDRIRHDPQYLSLRPENRVRVMSKLYDMYVEPSMKANGLEPPDKAHWLAGYGSPSLTNKLETQATLSKSGSFAAGAVTGYADTLRLVGNMLKGAEKLNFDLAATKEDEDLTTKVISKIFDFANTTDKINESYQGAFAVDHSASGWLSNFAGHVVSEAPAYMMATELTGGITLKAAIPSLAEKGAISAGAKLALHSLRAAGEVFGVEKGEDKSTHQASTDAWQTAVLGLGVGVLGKGISKGFTSMSDLLKWGGAKLGIGGEPFANKIAQLADHADGLEEHSTVGKPMALVGEGDKDVAQAVVHEQQLREKLAREFHPDKGEAAGTKSVWRNLSTGQRSKIKDFIAATTQHAAELQPLVNPELQTQANSKELVEQAKESPQFAAALEAVTKLTGMNPAGVMTKAQAEVVGTKTGLSSGLTQMTQAFDQGDLFGENISRSKGAKTVSQATLTNPKTGVDTFIKGTENYLPDSRGSKSVRGKVSFEGNKENHLLYITNSEAPPPIKAKARELLRSEFGLTKPEIEKKAGFLTTTHMADLEETGLLQKEGNVYNTTKPTQGRFRTKWQAALNQDLNATDLAQLKKLFNSKPELKKPLTDLITKLSSIRYASATPAASIERRAGIRQIRDIMARYK